MKSFPRTAIAIAAVGVVYLLSLLHVGIDGFWIIDNGNKYLQTRSIAERGEFTLAWPGSELDPELAFNPLPEPFSRVRDGELYSTFSPVFATVSSVPYRLLGDAGLYVVPFVASLLILLGVARLARQLGAGSTVAAGVVVVVGLGTPLWFYTLVFWEHTAAVALCVWAVTRLLAFLGTERRRCLVVGCVLLGVAVWFRDELYLLCAVVWVLLVVHVRKRRLATGTTAALAFLGALLPLWLFQGLAIGAPFGFHLGSHLFSAAGLREHLGGRLSVFYSMVVAWGPGVWWSLALAAPFLIAFVLAPRLPERAFRIVMPVALVVALLASGVSMAGYFTERSPIEWLQSSNSLFSTVPILILAFLRPRQQQTEDARPRSVEDFIISAALFYTVGYATVAPDLGSAGIHWGNRFLLVIYPLLGTLAVYHGWRWCAPEASSVQRVGVTLLVLVALASVAFQVQGIRLLAEKKEFARRFNVEVAGRPEEVVVTNVFWVPQELCRVFPDKPIFYIESMKEQLVLLRRLRQAGHERFLFVTKDRRLARSQPGSIFADGDLDYFSVALLSLDVSQFLGPP